MFSYLQEHAIERYAVELLKGLGYAYLHGFEIAIGGS
jgi:hypothetical protein